MDSEWLGFGWRRACKSDVRILRRREQVSEGSRTDWDMRVGSRRGQPHGRRGPVYCVAHSGYVSTGSRWEVWLRDVEDAWCGISGLVA